MHPLSSCPPEDAALIDTLAQRQWHQANPHRFHLLTRGALHALPSPAPRRGQRTYKPVWFERLQQERAAADAVRDTQEWLHSDVRLLLTPFPA